MRRPVSLVIGLVWSVTAALPVAGLPMPGPPMPGPPPPGPSMPGPPPSGSPAPIAMAVSASSTTVGRYVAPVMPLTVLRAFDRNLTAYGPGHRGVDLAVAVAGPVRAAGTGTVTVAASVAGRGIVVIAHADGISTEYEPITPSVRAGDRVVAGQVIGHQHGAHRGCPVAGCLHWGAKRDGRYVDPIGLLRPLGVVRLLPWT